MAKKAFDATLIRPPGTGTWTYLDIPFGVAEEAKRPEPRQRRIQAAVERIAHSGKKAK